MMFIIELLDFFADKRFNRLDLIKYIFLIKSEDDLKKERLIFLFDVRHYSNVKGV